jgi:hypothetical protein
MDIRSKEPVLHTHFSPRIIVDTLFRPHLTIMSSTIYMYRSVHKINPIKTGEGEKLIWGENEYVLTHTWISGGEIQYILIFPGICMVFYNFDRFPIKL